MADNNQQAARELQCRTCRWWKESSRARLIGECRRMPPHPAENMEDPRWWPHTHRHDWCGEWKESGNGNV